MTIQNHSALGVPGFQDQLLLRGADGRLSAQELSSLVDEYRALGAGERARVQEWLAGSPEGQAIRAALDGWTDGLSRVSHGLRGGLALAGIDQLSGDVLEARGVDVGQRRQISAGREELQRLLASEPPEVRASLLAAYERAALHGSPAERQAVLALCASPAWQAADARGRADLGLLCQQLPLGEVDGQSLSQGRGVRSPLVALAELAQATHRGAPTLLDRDSQGQTLLQTLAQQARRPDCGVDPAVSAAAGERGDRILGALVLELNDPGRVDQGSALDLGTCGATSLQLLLMRANPAEYARLATGLLSPAGEARLRDGQLLRRDPDSLAPTPGNHRTASERLFQSAVMEFGLAPQGLDYRLNRDERLPAGVVNRDQVAVSRADGRERQIGGLRTYAVGQVASALFGRPFTQDELDIGVLRRSGQGDQARALASRVLGPDGDLGERHLAAQLIWNRAEDPYGGAHWCVLERTYTAPDGQRYVVLHNPWGSRNRDGADRGRAPSGVWVPPGVQWEDQAAGTIRLPFERFVALTNFVVGPR